jgi:hypothetical protein
MQPIEGIEYQIGAAVADAAVAVAAGWIDYEAAGAMAPGTRTLGG